MTAIILGVIVGTCTSVVLAALTVAHLTESASEAAHCGQCEQLASRLVDAHAHAARWRRLAVAANAAGAEAAACGLEALAQLEAARATIRLREGRA